MSCPTQENTIKALIASKAINDKREIIDLEKFNLLNERYSQTAASLYGVMEGPLFSVETTTKPRNERLRLPTRVINRAIANEKAFDKLNTAVDASRATNGDIAKLTRIEDQPTDTQKKFNEELERWLFTPEFDAQAQENITSTIYGQTAGKLIDLVLAGQKVQLLYEDLNGMPLQLQVKQAYQSTLSDLQKKASLTPEEENLKSDLNVLLRDNVWDKFQKTVIDRLTVFGYKMTGEQGEFMGLQEGLRLKEYEDADLGISDAAETTDVPVEEEFEGEAGESGRGSHFHDFASVMLRNKSTMSSDIKIWLSAIPSNESSRIAIREYKGQKVQMDTTYVPLDEIIQDINSATLGQAANPDTMIAALRVAADRLPNKGHLRTVANLLQDAYKKGSKIGNEFFTKFYQTLNELTMIKFESIPRVMGITNFSGRGEFEKGADGTNTSDTRNMVMNVNRNDVPSNIREAWLQNLLRPLFLGRDEDSQTIDPRFIKDTWKAYQDFRDSVPKFFTKDGILEDTSDTGKAIVGGMLSALFQRIGIEVNDKVINELMLSPEWDQQLIIRGKKNAFNETTGILGTIFKNFRPEVANPEQSFNESGARYLSEKMAKYTDSFLNTSTRDEKGRNIWAYGLHDHFTHTYWDLKTAAQDLDKLRERISEQIANGVEEKDREQEKSPILDKLKMDYKGQSVILKMLSEAQGEDLKAMLNRFDYTIFNVTKNNVRGSRSKELPEQNEREYAATQLMLFTNHLIKAGSNTWSYKLSTTPSDKTKMYIIRTPDHDTRVDISGPEAKVLSATVDSFYNYFLGEYKSIKSYLDGDADFKKAIDANATAEPKIFYSFGQFNLKSPELWEKGQDGNYALRDLSPEVEAFVRDGIARQVNEDIAQYTKEWEKLGLIKNGRLITGFNPAYFNSLPEGISEKERLKGILKRVDTVREDENRPIADKSREEEALREEYRLVRERSDEQVTKYLVADFATNMHLHNIEMNMLLLGDPRGMLKSEKSKVSWAQFNGETIIGKDKIPVSWSNMATWADYLNGIRDNKSKRMAGVQASGSMGYYPKEKNTKNAVYLVDTNVPSKITSDLEKINPDAAERFSGISNQDGQMRHTAEADLDDKLAMGKISQSQYKSLLAKTIRQAEDIKKTGEVQPENKFTPEEKLIAQPQKPVIFGDVDDTDLRTSRTVYIKPSSVAMYPEFTQGTETDKLRQFFYDWNKKGGKRIDILPVMSAAKLGAKYPVSGVFNPDGSINTDALKAITDDRVDEIPANNFRIQLEVPFSTDHTSIRISTQQVKSIFNEILDVTFNTAHLDLGKDDMTGKELKDLHNNLYKTSFDIHFANLMRQTGARYNTATKDYDYASLEKLQRLLYDHATGNGYELNELDGLQLTPEKDEFMIPLGFTGDPGTYEKLLLSLLNNVILQRIHGRSFIMSTEAGFKPSKKVEAISGEKADEWISHNKTNIIWVKTGKGTSGFDPDKGLLPQRPNPDKEGTTLPSQMAITWNFQDKDGNVLDINDFTIQEGDHKFLDLDKIDPELLKAVGIRIPVQGHPSMSDMEIAAFIPGFMGDLVISSQDLVQQMGADFDIDKLYSYMYNYFYGNDDDVRESLRDVDTDYNKALEELKKMPRSIETNRRIALMESAKKARTIKYDIDQNQHFADFMEQSIDSRTDEFNAERKLDTTPDELKHFLQMLTPQEIEKINQSTFSSREKLQKGKKNEELKIIGKTPLSDIYSGEELDLARALKNHLGLYNTVWNMENSETQKLAKQYEKQQTEKEALVAKVEGLSEEQAKLNNTKKLMKIQTNYASPKSNSVEQLHNGMQDIYHTILSNRKVWDKMLEGINEGQLRDLSKDMKSLRPASDTSLPSMSSGRYITQEYFSNRSAKLGVGVFSVANTFMTLIEGKNVFLSQTNPDPKKYGNARLIPNPFIILDSSGEPVEFSEFASGKGYNRLISVFQSAALDDAKLKILAVLNENKYTMGITGTFAGLADDSKKDSVTGKPLLSESFITNLLGQPIIWEYIESLSKGNDSLEPSYVANWKQDLFDDLMAKYGALMAIHSDGSDSIEGFSEVQLKAGIVHGPEFNETGTIAPGEGKLSMNDFLNLQVKTLEAYKKLDEAADQVRQIQYLVNTDSKGVPATIQEAFFKQEMLKNLLNNPPSGIANLEKIFGDKGPDTLTNNFSILGIDAPLALFRGSDSTGPILPTASDKYKLFLRELKALKGVSRENSFNAKFASTAWAAFLSYLLSDPRLKVADRSLSSERRALVFDSALNKSLATEINEFKLTPLFLNNPLLKPLFNSLAVRTDKDNNEIKFVDFKGSVGLSVSKREINLALFFLKDINYPLFERIIKYTMLVPHANSPVSLRKYIPNIYLEAVGIGEAMRNLNRTLNSSPNTPITDANISINPDFPPVRPLHQMLFQHFPNEAPRFDPESVTFTSEGNMFAITYGDNPEFFRSYGNSNGDRLMVPHQFVSYYDTRGDKAYALYKLVKSDPYGESEYAKINALGAYNLSEFDASYFDDTPMESILPKNQLAFKYTPADAYDSVDRNLPASLDQMIGHSGGAYGADSLWNVVGKEFGIFFQHYRADSNLSKTLKNLLTSEQQAEFTSKLTGAELDEGYAALKSLYKRDFEHNSNNDLLARNYFQVKNSQAVYAMTPLSSPTTVSGGTRYAVEFSKHQGKPIFVWDTNSQEWHKWNGNRFVPTGTPYLTKDFAAIGSRNLELYSIPKSKDSSGKVTEWGDNKDKFVGPDVKAKAMQAMRDVYAKTLAIINGEQLTETSKKFIDTPPAAVITYDSPKDANIGHLRNKYGFDPAKSGKDNAVSILSKIARNSDNDSYRILSDILLKVAQQQGTLDNISFELGKVNEYQNGTVRLNVDMDDQDKFQRVIQYNILHELGHHYIGSKLDDGSEISRVLSRNIDSMIGELAKPENLQKAIDMFGLKRTNPEILLAKLAELRAQASVSESVDKNLVKFSSEEERSILNPLINKHEFVASLLNDEKTQKWANNVKHEGGSQNIFSKFFDILRGMFNNFLRAIGVKLSGKVDTVLKNGIRVITELLSKDPIGMQRSAMEDLQPDHTVSMEMNGFDTSKTGKKALLWMPKEAKFRPDVEAKTLIGAIIEGKRVQSSRTRLQRQALELKVGGVDGQGKPLGNPYVWIRDDNNLDKREVLIKVDIIHQQSNGSRGITAEEWSQREGWDKSYAISKPEVLGSKYYAVDFHYVDPTDITGIENSEKPNDLNPKPDENGQLNLFAKLTDLEDYPGFNDEGPIEGETDPEEIARLATARQYMTNLTERRNSLYVTLNSVYRDKKLSSQDRETKVDQIQGRIDGVNSDIEKVIAKFDAETISRIASKDLAYAKQLSKTPNLTTAQFIEIAQITQTYRQLYRDIDPSYGDFIDDTLLQSLENAKNDADQLQTDINDRNWEGIQTLFKSHLGQILTRDQVYDNMETSKSWRSNLLAAVENDNKLVRLAGKMLTDMQVQSDLYTEDLTHRFEKGVKTRLETGHDPKDFVKTYEIKSPLTNVSKTVRNWISRYDQKAYEEKIGAIYSATPYTGPALYRWRANQLKRLQFIVDPRFFAWEDYNMEMNLHGENALTPEDHDAWFKAFQDYMKHDYEMYPSEYAPSRLIDVYNQAKKKYERYEKQRNATKKMIDEEYEENPALAASVFNDWLAFNSPHHVMNERYSLHPEATFTGIDKAPHKTSPPLISEINPATGKPMFVPWSRVNPITGEKVRVRHGMDHLQSKVRNRDLDTGAPTGLINSDYVKWEIEDMEKNQDIRDRNAKAELDAIPGEAPKLEELHHTKLEFLKYLQDLEAELLKHFPYHMTRDKLWFQMLDIQKPLEEELAELKPFYKYRMRAAMAWDKVVDTVSVPTIKRELDRIDRLTGEIKKDYNLSLITQERPRNYNPAILGNTINNQGIGQTKTEDPIHYMDTLIKAASIFAHKADVERELQRLQYAFVNEQLTNTPLPGETAGTPYIKGDDANLFTKTINHRLYEDHADQFGILSTDPQKSEAFRAGRLNIGDLPNSRNSVLGKYALTKVQRRKLEALRKRESALNIELGKADDKTAPEKITALKNDLEIVTQAIDRINRVRTPVSNYRAFEAYLRLNYLGWNPAGRVVHTMAVALRRELMMTADPRMSSMGSYIKGLGKAMRTYGLGYGAATSATYAGLAAVTAPILHMINAGVDPGMVHTALNSLTHFTAENIPISVGIAAGLGVANVAWNNILAAREKKELDLVLKYFFGDRFFESNSEEQIRRVKTSGTFTPLGLVQKADHFNKSVTLCRMLYHEKVTCPDGKKRPLMEAFKLNDAGTDIEWKTDLYGPKESHGMNLTGKDNQGMAKLRNLASTNIRRVHGDEPFLIRLSQTNAGLWNALTMLKSFMIQTGQMLWAGPWTDAQSGIRNIGFFQTIHKSSYEKADTEAEGKAPDFYKFNRRGFYIFASMMIATYFMMLGASEIIKKPDHRGEAPGDQELIYMNNLLGRLELGESQFYDPNAVVTKSLMGIDPKISYFHDVTQLLAAFAKASEAKDRIMGNPTHGPVLADKQKREEQIANGLAIHNKPLVIIDNAPKYNKFYDDVEEGPLLKYDIDDNGGHSEWTTEDAYGAPSRIAYHAMKLLPGFHSFHTQMSMERANNLSTK